MEAVRNFSIRFLRSRIQFRVTSTIIKVEWVGCTGANHPNWQTMVKSTLSQLVKYESRESESTTFFKCFYHVNSIWVKILGVRWWIKNLISIFSHDISSKQAALKGLIIYSENWMPVKSLWSFENTFTPLNVFNSNKLTLKLYVIVLFFNSGISVSTLTL